MKYALINYKKANLDSTIKGLFHLSINDLENYQSVLIVGYDEKNTIVMDPMTGTIYRKGMNDSTEWFERSGNKFIAYVKAE